MASPSVFKPQKCEFKEPKNSLSVKSGPCFAHIKYFSHNPFPMSLTCSSEISFGSPSKDIIAHFPEQFKFVSLFYAIIRLEKLESCRAEARRGAMKHRRIYTQKLFGRRNSSRQGAPSKQGDGVFTYVEPKRAEEQRSIGGFIRKRKKPR